MKKILASVLALVGITSSMSEAQSIQTVKSDSVRYSMPTVSGDNIEFVMPTKETFVGAPQFHEDEWSQIEFFSKARLSEIQKILIEYKPFELKNRGEYGWEKIFSRDIKREPIFKGNLTSKALSEFLGKSLTGAPILTTTSQPLGQVKYGFTISIAEGVFLYGIESENGISTLSSMVQNGADDSQLTNTFIKLNKEKSLILVDWRRQLILASVSSTGQIELWQP
jgi:hypothetical protein